MTMKESIRRLLTGILGLTMVVTLAACDAAKPEDTVQTGLDALRAGDQKTALACFDSMAKDALQGGDTAKETEKLLYSKMTYTIKDVKTEGRTATVTTEIQALDMNLVLQKAMSELMQLAMGAIDSEGKTLTEAEVNAKTEEILLKYMNETTDKSIKTVDIHLKRQDDAWQIETSDELMNALTGGLGSVSNGLSGSAGR